MSDNQTLKEAMPELYGFDANQLRAILENLGGELENIYKLPQHEWWMVLSLLVMQQSRLAMEAREAAEIAEAVAE